MRVRARHGIRRIPILLAIGLACLATPASANIGVPMLFVAMPPLLVALAPIIAVEGAILWKGLQLPVSRAILTSLVANAVSTLVGVPLVWFLLVGLQVVTGADGMLPVATRREQIVAVMRQAAWLPPYLDHDLAWMIPFALLLLLVPCFILTLPVERWVLMRMNPQLQRARATRLIVLANVVTYLGLAVVPAASLLLAD